MRVYVVSKGRLACVQRLLRSLRGDDDEWNDRYESVVIFDDSACDDLADEFDRWRDRHGFINSGTLRTAECIDLVQREIEHVPSSVRGTAERLFRLPRSGEWQPGGVRNLVVAHARRDGLEQCVWIDDDIVFGALEMEEIPLHASGPGILEEMCGSLSGDVLAAGCGYIGRDDLSMADHANLLIRAASGRSESVGQSRDECLAALGRVPRRLPVRVTSVEATHEDAYRGPAGVSSGCLAVRRAGLDIAPLPTCYNEDWIWLWLLGPPARTVRRVPGCVVHAPPVLSDLDEHTLVSQQIGEAIYEAVRALCPDDATTLQRVRALGKVSDSSLGARLASETQVLLDVASGSRRLVDSVDDPLIKRGAHALEMLLRGAAVQLQNVDSQRIGRELRRYAEVALWWSDAAR